MYNYWCQRNVFTFAQGGSNLVRQAKEGAPHEAHELGNPGIPRRGSRTQRGAVQAGQIISTNQISEDFEANTVGNNTNRLDLHVGWQQQQYNPKSTATPMVTISRCAWSARAGRTGVFLHWGDMARNPRFPRSAGLWTVT